MLINWIQENIVLPLSDLATGQSVSSKLRFLMKSKDWTREEIDAFQNNRLRMLIKHAYESVPFYRDYMHQHGLTPDDIQSKADLHKLPIVTKEIMRQEGIERFTSESFPASKRITMSSSGSTGKPFVHYITKEDYSMNIAGNLRGWYDMGWRLGDKYIKMSQNPRGLFKRIQDWLSRDLYVATADLSDIHMQEILQQVEKYQPIIIRSYPDPMFILSQYKLKHPEFKYVPKAITTTGNTLHPHVREIIEKAWGCKIYDSYCSEGNSVAFECPTHTGYHSAEEYGITEILDENDMPIENGEGRVVTTDLWNYAHPFIRYDVQDRVVVSNEICSCKRSHLRFISFKGRDNEVLEMPNGRRFIVHHFTGFFEPTVTPQLQDSIDQFQVVKHKDDSITIKLVVNNKYQGEIGQFIAHYWTEQVGYPVEVEVVDRIPIMGNNKRRFILIEK